MNTILGNLSGFFARCLFALVILTQMQWATAASGSWSETTTTTDDGASQIDKSGVEASLQPEIGKSGANNGSTDTTASNDWSDSKPQFAAPLLRFKVETAPDHFYEYLQEVVVDTQMPLTIRLEGLNGLVSDHYTLRVFDGPGRNANLVYYTHLVFSNIDNNYVEDDIDPLFLPYQAPANAEKYYMRASPLIGGQDTGEYPPSNIVVVKHRAGGPTTNFGSDMGHPGHLGPQRMFLDINKVEVVQAQEEDDEEPYLLAFAIFLDGNGINIDNLSTTGSVAVKHNHGNHGNIPQPYGALGSGDTVSLTMANGYFERIMRPINPEKLDALLIPGTTESVYTMTRMMKATSAILFVVALEEDDTSDEAVDAVRSAIVSGLETELNQAIRTTPLSAFAQAIQQDGNLESIFPFAEIEARLLAAAIAAATAEELDDLINYSTFMLGAPSFELLSFLIAANQDDVIGTGHKVVTLEELYHEGRPIALPPIEVSGENARYRIFAKAGLCKFNAPQEPANTKCVPKVQ